MEYFKEKEIILWDFDGVILDSMEIRSLGFRKVLSQYPAEQVEELLTFHKQNGGLSRYVKFRYFLEEIRGEENAKEEVQQMSEAYSSIMRKKLKSKDLLIDEVLEFISKNHKKFDMHIVSGSDGDELRYLCSNLEISDYFLSINGSPTPKIELVSLLLSNYSYVNEKVCLIGDSINDYDAAMANNIEFFGYNNSDLKKKETRYIENF
ncbi:HAD family hydrolase [Christiangramia crocea]|uniref:phosphoglycolate phosphatase n=1 Tax=Christiangramia crocea TaxID=2904124 RepID=A0A9X2A6S3_9FLAO|nr:HAD hydrolase-like protein [Gramella crocea]MCG9972599.1 HAD hydrolase-like protein [Gramella crocea]